MASPFSKAPSASFPFSVFDLSYTKRFDCDMGLLIPIYEQEVYPGEKYKVGVAFNIKTMPMVAPLMGNIDVYFHYFFVPYRTIHNRATMSKWADNNTFEDFISGQDSTHTIPMLSDIATTLGSGGHPVFFSGDGEISVAADSKHVLSSYFGFPEKYQAIFLSGAIYPVDPSSAIAKVIPQYLWRAYAKIISDYYVDENLQGNFINRFDSFSQSDDLFEGLPNYCFRRAWKKDYFTSALPFQQKGTPVSLPIDISFVTSQSNPFVDNVFGDSYWITQSAQAGLNLNANTDNRIQPFMAGGSSSSEDYLRSQFSSKMIDALNSSFNAGLMKVNATSFNISDFRLVNAIQAWMERNAVAGTRYVEYLKGQYGFAPRDDEVDRARYLGGYRAPLLVQQVQQTSSTFSDSTAQGTLTGQGYSVDASSIFNERFYEHGVIMGLMSIMPQASYADGIDRNWIKRDVYDWHVPVFNNLSEEEVLQCEVAPSSEPFKIFGYQQRKGYLRWRKDITCGELAPSGSLHYWTLTRDLRNGAALNSNFIACKPTKDFLAYPDGSTFVCEIGNLVKAARQLPYIPEPSLRTY